MTARKVEIDRGLTNNSTDLAKISKPTKVAAALGSAQQQNPPEKETTAQQQIASQPDWDNKLKAYEEFMGTLQMKKQRFEGIAAELISKNNITPLTLGHFIDTSHDYYQALETAIELQRHLHSYIYRPNNFAGTDKEDELLSLINATSPLIDQFNKGLDAASLRVAEKIMQPVPTRQVSAAQAPARQVSAAQAPASQVSEAQAPASQVSAAQAPASQVSEAQASASQVSGAQAPPKISADLKDIIPHIKQVYDNAYSNTNIWGFKLGGIFGWFKSKFRMSERYKEIEFLDAISKDSRCTPIARVEAVALVRNAIRDSEYFGSGSKLASMLDNALPEESQNSANRGLTELIDLLDSKLELKNLMPPSLHSLVYPPETIYSGGPDL